MGAGVLVAVHGHDDEPSTARDWGRRVAPAGWEVVAPGSPRDPDGVRSWFSSGPRGVDPAELDAAVARIADVVARIGGGGRPVVLAGFSQGAAVVLEVASRRVAPVAAVVALCGFLPEPHHGPSRGDDGSGAPTGPAAPAGSPPVLVVGGTEDDVVPEVVGRDAAALLAAEGMDVTTAAVAGGHEVGAAAVAHVREWLAGVLRDGPRVSLGLPVDRVAAGAELVSADAVSDLASAYERLGYHAAYVTDHPAPDARWLDAGGHHALEPTVVLALAAAATRRLLVHTNVYVLPYRNPFLAAKALATLDLVADGRLIAGVAAGYQRREFAALGVELDDRAALMDEALSLLPRIWSGETLEARGRGWSARAVTSLPRPVQRPHPPLWVGGNSSAALRRAVRHGQGWSPFPTPPGAAAALGTAAITDRSELVAALARLRDVTEREGRDEPPTVCFVPFRLGDYLADPDAGLSPLAEEVVDLHELGVAWTALSVPGSSRAQVVERAAALSEALGLRPAATV